MVSRAQIDKLVHVRTTLTEFFDKALERCGEDSVITDLMAKRGYESYEMYETLFDMGFFYIEDFYELREKFPEYTNEQFLEWGLINDKGNYILSRRYVTAIKDISGKVVALVGWHPKGGSRKYVTTPTFGFSRDTSFFNYDHAFKLSWGKFNGLVFLVEGIFDTIALRSLGLPVIGVQGLEMSVIKSEMLKRFAKVVAIPDNDRSGKSVIPYTNAITGKGTKFIWKIPVPHVFVILDKIKGVKDVDDFSKEKGAYDLLLSVQDKLHLIHL